MDEFEQEGLVEFQVNASHMIGVSLEANEHRKYWLALHKANPTPYTAYYHRVANQEYNRASDAVYAKIREEKMPLAKQFWNQKNIRDDKY